jgi:hypothetical protein
LPRALVKLERSLSKHHTLGLHKRIVTALRHYSDYRFWQIAVAGLKITRPSFIHFEKITRAGFMAEIFSDFLQFESITD